MLRRWIKAWQEHKAKKAFRQRVMQAAWAAFRAQHPDKVNRMMHPYIEAEEEGRVVVAVCYMANHIPPARAFYAVDPVTLTASALPDYHSAKPWR